MEHGTTEPFTRATPPASARDITDAIATGSFDEQIPLLIDAINARNTVIARLRYEQARERIVLNGRVRISDSATPQYIRGLVGEVHGFEGDRVVVCLGSPVGKFKSGHIECPPELLEPVEG
jgi:hypothetical protein